jgi:hypothetical protein
MVMIWLVGSSHNFISNIGIFEGSLVGMGGQTKSCKMGSFVSFIKSRRFRLAMYGKLVDNVGVVLVGEMKAVVECLPLSLFDGNLLLMGMGFRGGDRRSCDYQG